MMSGRNILPVLTALLLIFSCLSPGVNAQTVRIEQVNTSDFPRMRALVRMVDDRDQLLGGGREFVFNLRENGATINNFALVPPDGSAPDSVSVLFSVAAELFANSNDRQLIRTALDSAMAIPVIGAAEFALCVYQDRPLIVQDFTTNAAALLRRFDEFSAWKVARDNASDAAYSRPFGYVRFRETGRHPYRIIALARDAYRPNFSTEFTAILDGNNEQIYNLQLVNNEDAIVGTGQKTLFIDALEHPRRLNTALRDVMLHALNRRAFAVEWYSRARCAGRSQLVIDSPQFNNADTAWFNLDAALLPRLSVEPDFIDFGVLAPGESRDTLLTLIARGGDQRIDQIVSNNPRFQVINAPGRGELLTRDQPVSLTLRFQSVDGALASGALVFKSNACDAVSLECVGGDKLAAAADGDRLTLEAPAAGELLGEHHLYTIRWSGVGPNIPVRLEYALAGQPRRYLISDQARGGSYEWLVPDHPGNALQVFVSLQQPPDGRATPQRQQIRSFSSAFALSADGQLLATRSNTGTIDFNRTADGVQVRSIDLGLNFNVNMAAWHPAGRYMALAFGSSGLALLDTTTGDVDYQPDFMSNSITAAAWSPSGDYLAVADRTGNVAIWNLAERRFERSAVFGSTEYNVKLVWTADEQYVALVNYDRRLVAWPWRNENVGPYTVAEAGSSFSDLAAGPAGNELAVLSYAGHCVVIELDNPAALRRIDLPVNGADVLAWDHVRGLLYIFDTAEPDLLRIAVDDGQPIASINIGRGARAIQLDGDGSTALVFRTAPNGLYKFSAFNLPDFAPRSQLQGPEVNARTVQWLLDGTGLIVSAFSAPMQWDAATERLSPLPPAASESLREFRLQPSTGRRALLNNREEIELYDAADNLLATGDPGSLAKNLQWRADRNQVGIVRNRELFLFDGDAAQFSRVLSLDANVAAYDWEPAGELRAAVTLNGPFVLLWNPENGTLDTVDFKQPARFSPVVSTVAWRPDGAQFAVGGSEGFLAIHDLENEENAKLFVGEDARYAGVTALAWSADGASLAVAFNNLVVRIFELNGGPDRSFTKKYSSQIRELAWNPDGRRLAVRSDLGDVQIWDTGIIPSQTQADSATIGTADARIDVLDGLFPDTQIFVQSPADQPAALVNIGARPWTYRRINYSSFAWSPEFGLVEPRAQQQTIAPGDTLSINLQFRPTNPGDIEHSIYLDVGDTIVGVSLRGRALPLDLLQPRAELDMGVIPLGAAPRDTLLSGFLINTSDQPHTLTDIAIIGPHASHFDLPESPVGRTLAPGALLELTVRFTPVAAGVNNALLALEVDGTPQPRELLLRARTITPILDVEDFSAAAGEVAYARVFFSEPDVLRAADITSRRCRVELEYNSDMLVPLESAAILPAGAEHRVRASFDFTWDGRSAVLGDVAFTAALGHLEQSPVRVSAFAWLDVSGTASTEAGEGGAGLFTLENLCRVDGTRLFNPRGSSPELRVVPDPGDGEAEIVGISIERGDLQFDIFDRLGHRVWRIRRQMLEPGPFRIPVDLRDLPTGLYLIRMRSLSVELFNTLVILK